MATLNKLQKVINLFNKMLNLRASTYFKIGLAASLAAVFLGVLSFINFEFFLKYATTNESVNPDVKYLILGVGILGIIYHGLMMYREKVHLLKGSTMPIANPNFAATIHFTVGIKKSAAITKVDERWLSSLDDCDVFKNDLFDEGATAVLECVGIDLDEEGSFEVEVLGFAKYEESPDYEIVDLKTTSSLRGGIKRESIRQNIFCYMGVNDSV